MKKYLVFTDTHITPHSEFSGPTEDGLTDNLHTIKKTFAWVEQLIHKSPVNAVVHMGDVFDTDGYLDSMSMNVGVDVFSSMGRLCSSLKIPFYVLVGNHDLYSEVNNLHSLSVLRCLEGVTVIDKPRIINRAAFVPWSDDLEMVSEFLLSETYDVSFSHLEILGAMMFKGAPYRASGVPVEVFGGIVGLNGHDHHPSKITPNLFNVGSTLTRSFHDVGTEPRCATFLNVVNGKFKIKKVCNPYALHFCDIHVDEKLKWQVLEDMEGVPHDRICARVFYEREFEEKAQEVKEHIRGARLVLAEDQKQQDESAIAVSFSPAENLSRYLEETYEDEDLRKDLLTEALTIFDGLETEALGTPSLHFISIEITDFMSVEYAKINYTNGLVLIEGVNQSNLQEDSNGSGKTVLATEALFWCITGKSLRGLRGNDVTKEGKKGCTVITKFRVNGKMFELRRSRPVHVQLLENGTDISARTNRSVDARIPQILGRSFDDLRHSVLMTSGLSHKFTSLGYPDRVRLLERMSPGLLVYQAAGVRVSEAKKDAHSSVKTTHAVIETLQSQEEDLTDALELAAKAHATQRENLERRIATIKNDIEEENALADKYRKEITSFENLVQSLESKIEAISSKKDETAADSVSIAKVLANVSAEIRRLEHLKSEADRLEREGKCWVCGTPSDNISTREGLEDTLARLTKKKVSVNARKTLLQGTLKTINDKSTALSKKSRETERKLRESRNALQHAERAISGYEGDLTKVELDSEKSKIRIDEKEKALQSVKERVQSAQDNLVPLVERAALYDTLDNVFDVTGIRSYLIRGPVLGYLNQSLRSYSETMMGEDVIKLSATKELKSGGRVNKIEVELTGRSYQKRSSGQRRRIDLAIQFALNDLATGPSQTNLLVLDEVTEFLDRTGLQAVVLVLAKKAKTRAVMLVSNVLELKSMIRTRWTASYEEDTTTLILPISSTTQELRSESP